MDKSPVTNVIRMLNPFAQAGEKYLEFPAAGGVAGHLANDFLQQLPSDFSRIELALSELTFRPGNKSSATVLYRLVQDLTGPAELCHFKLIAVFGSDLCRFLEDPTAMTSDRLKVVRLYVDAMKQVANRKITGDGDGVGLRISHRLHAMIGMVLQGKKRFH